MSKEPAMLPYKEVMAALREIVTAVNTLMERVDAIEERLSELEKIGAVTDASSTDPPSSLRPEGLTRGDPNAMAEAEGAFGKMSGSSPRPFKLSYEVGGFEVLLSPNESGGYDLTCPGLPGVAISAGSIAEALQLAHNAIEATVDQLKAKRYLGR